MDSLPDSFKIILGLIVAAFWIIGKIAEAKKQRQQQEEQPWPPDDEWPPEETYEEAAPPPLPSQRSAPPPLPQFIPSSDAELLRQQTMQEKLASIRKEKREKRNTPARAAAKSAPTPKTTLVSPSLKARLRDRRELRRAIVMREILDPPVGLR